jgi:hypothetical protein
VFGHLLLVVFWLYLVLANLEEVFKLFQASVLLVLPVPVVVLLSTHVRVVERVSTSLIPLVLHWLAKTEAPSIEVLEVVQSHSLWLIVVHQSLLFQKAWHVGVCVPTDEGACRLWVPILSNHRSKVLYWSGCPAHEEGVWLLHLRLPSLKLVHHRLLRTHKLIWLLLRHKLLIILLELHSRLELVLLWPLRRVGTIVQKVIKLVQGTTRAWAG